MISRIMMQGKQRDYWRKKGRKLRWVLTLKIVDTKNFPKSKKILGSKVVMRKKKMNMAQRLNKVN